MPLSAPLLDGEEVVLPAGTTVMKAKGCGECLKTGYMGRIGIFEVVLMDDDMRELVKQKASPRAYRAILKKQGVSSLRRIGLARVREGITTVDEVVRVTT
jgi:general secretion pathway protein E/type IV pilus assembly protein PilB